MAAPDRQIAIRQAMQGDVEAATADLDLAQHGVAAGGIEQAPVGARDRRRRRIAA